MPRGSRRGQVGNKTHPKPVSYVSYSSDTSSQFSAEAIEIENVQEAVEDGDVIQEDAVWWHSNILSRHLW